MKNKFYKRYLLDQITWIKNHPIIVIVFCAIIAMSLCLIIGLNQSVWFDEAYSIMVAKQPVAEIIRLASLDTHPPLYYILLSGWGGVFGWGELALRSFSVLAMGGAVVFAGLLLKRFFGMRITLISLPFVMFAPVLLRYGFEIRMYALASLIGIAATYVLLRAFDARKSSQVWLLYGLYALLVALGMYTLYYTALLWAAHLVWLLWRGYSTKDPFIKAKWLWAYLVSFVLFLPWLPTFLNQINNGALASISQSMTLDNLIGVVSFSFVYQPVWQLGPVMSLAIVFALLMTSYLSIRAFRVVTKAQKPYLLMLACYVVVPIIILTLIGLFRPMYTERYLSHILIGGSLFVGVASALATYQSSRVVKILTATLATIVLTGVCQLIQVGNYNFQRLQKPDVGQASAFITNCNDSTRVLAADPYVAIELSYYLPTCQIHFYSDTAILGGGYAPLSNSSLRVSNPERQVKDLRTVYHVYYDQPKLRMPENMQLRSRHNINALTVERYSIN